MHFSTTTIVAAVASLSGMALAQNKFTYGTTSTTRSGVVGANSNGPTNPDAPSLGTPINQTSMARLVSVNSIDDWCTFGPPTPNSTIADVEAITVAYCTKARNNARVIPDGTITGAHFVKTPLYVQVMALGDFTKIGFAPGDMGGELDPHGATNMGNPVGGNVTSNVSGKDVFYEEWMNFVAANEICIRVCTAASEQVSTAQECLHTLDEMGCNFVMPGNYADNVFETCDGDAAYPPGDYVESDGSTSTFVQYFSSVYTNTANGQEQTFVNGTPDEVTPTAAFSTPSTSNCQTTSTIANNIASIVSSSTASSSSSASSGITSSKTSSTKSTNTSSSSGSQNTSGSNASSSSGSSGASTLAVSMLTVAGGLFAGVFLF